MLSAAVVLSRRRRALASLAGHQRALDVALLVLALIVVLLAALSLRG